MHKQLPEPMLKFLVEKQRVTVKKGGADSKGSHGLVFLSHKCLRLHRRVPKGPHPPLHLCCLAGQAPQSCDPSDTLDTDRPHPQHCPALLAAACAVSTLSLCRAAAKPYTPALPANGLRQLGMEVLRIRSGNWYCFKKKIEHPSTPRPPPHF